MCGSGPRGPLPLLPVSSGILVQRSGNPSSGDDVVPPGQFHSTAPFVPSLAKAEPFPSLRLSKATECQVQGPRYGRTGGLLQGPDWPFNIESARAEDL